MASADFRGRAEQLFADLGTDSISGPYKPDDRDREAAKIARLRQLRLARCAEAGPEKAAPQAATGVVGRTR